MHGRPTWRERARRLSLAFLSVALWLALTQVLATCGGTEDPPPGGDASNALVWDQGNWDQKNWQ